MGTSCNHLRLRGTTYWWRRRIPAAPGRGFPVHVCRSLRTKDQVLARRRARACSAAFDRAMLLVMSDSSVTKEDLKRVLDDIFQRILGDGERERAVRDPGPPPWTPEPQDDPRYEGLEPEEWDSVPTPPEQWTEEWRYAVVMNAQEDVRPLLDDALDGRRIEMPRDTVEWRRLSRLALIVAARAHEINGRREDGDYRDGWPASAGIPIDEMPSTRRQPDSPPAYQEPLSTTSTAVSSALSQAPVAQASPLFSESYREFMRIEARTNAKSAKQATVAMNKFVSLMGDRPVNQIRQSVVEEFRIRMQKMPNLFGKSIYIGMPALDAFTAVERLRADIAATPGAGPVSWNKKSLPRADAVRLAQPTSMKTVNRDFSFFTTWGAFMLKNDERRLLLHNQKCPFTGLAFTKKQTRTEAQRQGRERRQFQRDELIALLGAPLFREPFQFEPDKAGKAQLQQARFWSIMIGLYAGLRLGEIAQLRPSDIGIEEGIPRIMLRSDAKRAFKTEAGDWVVPLHPLLVEFGLLDFARRTAETGSERLLPGMKDKGGQHGASVSVWFTPFRRSQGVESAQTVFHSFRHCFVTGIRSRLGTDEALIDQIIGHDEYGSVRRTYTGDLPLSLKAEAVSAIDYKIDLSHILSWAMSGG